LGPEEITKDIPNVSDTILAGLDDDGVVRIGTRVKPGDILVGKVTLKGDIQYSPEEKLLRAIFGEKSREVRDTSLRVPPGVEGTVIDVKIFARGGVRRSKRYKQEVENQIVQFDKHYNHHVAFLTEMIEQKIINLLHKQTPTLSSYKEYILNDVLDKSLLTGLSLEELCKIKIKSKTVSDTIKRICTAYDTQLRILQGLKEERINKMKRGDTLPSGVIKMVKVYIAMKRHISVGDKIAGRHGNKGVVSIIVPREDMPYMEDGTPIDVVLNPLGIPSRMNVGQILETLLGLAGAELALNVTKAMKEGFQSVKNSLIEAYGKTLIDDYEKLYGEDGIKDLGLRTSTNGVLFKTPVFDSASADEDIKPMLKTLGLPPSGAFRLRDGRSGDYLEQLVTVGILYMVKLNHMIDDKLHARSVGPYSLVTQQPLGGKAKHGGQRLGEMEVWALEAYGAAYTLQEMLTYKSDDVTGRHKAYQAIVNNEDVPAPGVPESFNVLIKELQSLGLQVDLLKIGKQDFGVPTEVNLPKARQEDFNE
jgi:DNA-directed RNA polymerase subunit beta